MQASGVFEYIHLLSQSQTSWLIYTPQLMCKPLQHYLPRWVSLTLIDQQYFSVNHQERKCVRSDERLTIETSAFESLYGGQFTHNPVDKTKLSCSTPHRLSTTVSLETYPLYSSEKNFSTLTFAIYRFCFALGIQ